MTLSEKGLPIIFEGGIHYIEDPAYPGEKITLFCMNNERHWPHHTEDMGDVQVPEYTEGYLTPGKFDSEADYKECMRRLSKLLYAGYPYNGERLYKIVDNSELHTPTESQFNEMLIPTPVLQTAFPYLGHHSFTYKDWETNDTEHLDELRRFMNAVAKLYPDGQTSNGVTYSDITAMPFYKAVFCMLYEAEGTTPLQNFAIMYSDSYFVTEEQAYNATQDAVWRLLHQYNIEDNNMNDLEHDALAQVLYVYSERGGLLNYEPSLKDVHLTGDLKFTYNPKDGYWHSGALKIIEPVEYNGLYRLELPKGMSALCDNITYVYGNEEYELVSDHQPTIEDTFTIKAEFVWMKDFKQYAPMGDVEVHGKKFQNMVGVVTENEANKDRYITTYNGKKDHAEGVLSKDTAVDVINNRQSDQAPSQGKDEENPDKEVSDNGTAVKTGDYTNMWQYAFTAIAAFIVTASVFGLKEWKRKR